MNTRNFLTAVTLGVVLPVALMQGCGGGGGGGGSSSPNPTSTPTSSRRLVVQLRDATGAAVDGIVTISDIVMATTGGQATFNSVRSGNVMVQAEVNGITTNGTATVASTGTSTFTLTISSRITPGPTTTPPAPPF